MTHTFARGRNRVMRRVMIALAWVVAVRVPAVHAQVAAGGDRVRFDRDAARFASANAAARAMTSGGVALGWVPRRQTRLSASLDVTRLTGQTEGTERAVIVRVKQAF